MREPPSEHGLLELARDILRNELVPMLPPEKRLIGLMVANAMSIAGRQLKAGELPERDELAALERLLASEQHSRPSPLPIDDVRARLASLNQLLSREIRSGDIVNGAQRDAVLKHLRQVTRQRVQESSGSPAPQI